VIGERWKLPVEEAPEPALEAAGQSDAVMRQLGLEDRVRVIDEGAAGTPARHARRDEPLVVVGVDQIDVASREAFPESPRKERVEQEQLPVGRPRRGPPVEAEIADPV
jgi:hypothetical protein